MKEQDKIELQLIDYIDGLLTSEQQRDIERLIADDPEVRLRYEELKATIALIESDTEMEPDSSLELEFDKMLSEEMDNTTGHSQSSGGMTITFKPMQVAAAIAFVVCGAFLTVWLTSDTQENSDEIAALKNEMAETKILLMQAMQDEYSASRRIQGVNASYSLSNADDQIIQALVEAMNTDDNTNVRLAAVEALGQFAEQEGVVDALISSLETQSDPLVQIALINLMVKLKEQKAVKELRKIIDKETNIDAVKDEAHMAVFKLS